MTLGIVAALHDEIAGLLGDMAPGAHVEHIGQRHYHVGELAGQPCVVVLARLGKVAAAATAAALIHRYNVDGVIFTGVAGGIAHGVHVGDVVVADALAQHDLDARPFFPLHEVPLLGVDRLPVDTGLSERLAHAVRGFLDEDMPRLIGAPTRETFGLAQPGLHRGLIISGDQFIGDPAKVEQLRQALPGALAVEMEGAAVAQVCFEYGVPCAVLRTISDSADDQAHVDFPAFLTSVASVYSHGILTRFLAAR